MIRTDSQRLEDIVELLAELCYKVEKLLELKSKQMEGLNDKTKRKDNKKSDNQK